MNKNNFIEYIKYKNKNFKLTLKIIFKLIKCRIIKNEGKVFIRCFWNLLKSPL